MRARHPVSEPGPSPTPRTPEGLASAVRLERLAQAAHRRACGEAHIARDYDSSMRHLGESIISRRETERLQRTQALRGLA